MNELKMIKDVLVCLNNVGNEDNIIQVAARFALENNARLAGIFVMVATINSYYAYEHWSADLMQRLIDECNENAERAQQRFNQSLSVPPNR